MQSLGFDFRQEALLNNLTEEITKSSEIEGELLNKDKVRSSIARRLNIHIVFHKENLTFKGDGKQDHYQKMMMTMLGAVAELERSILLERQREGIAIAKAKGKYKENTL